MTDHNNKRKNDERLSTSSKKNELQSTADATVELSESLLLLSSHQQQQQPPPQPQPQQHPLLRDVAAGMNPVTLMTGFYGPRGERIRHQVHEGALRLPQNALDIISPTVVDDATTAGRANDKVYILPDLDAVQRPSLDLNINPLIVTEVRNEDIVQEDISPIDGTVRTTTYTKTIITHHTIARPLPVVLPVVDAQRNEIERIRGGFEDGNEENDAVEGAVVQSIPVVGAAPVGTTTAHDDNINTLLPGQPLSTGTEVATLAVPMESGPIPMDVDPISLPPASQIAITAPVPVPAAVPVEIPPVGVATNSGPIVVPLTLPVPAQVEAPLLPVPSMVAPADPTLQQQQISNMEKALLSTINGHVTITSNNPTVPMMTGSTALTAVPIVPEKTITAVVESVTSVSESSITTKPVTVTSSVLAPSVMKETEAAQVLPLMKRPFERYEAHISQSNDTSTTTTAAISHHKINFPGWYQSDRVASLERAVLSEWFDGSATHRTESSYLEAREKIIDMSQTIGSDHYLTGTMVRRTIPSDAGSLLRLHAFLTSYSMINQNAINESTPTPMVLLSNKKAKVTKDWNTDEVMKMTLMNAVVEQSHKTRIESENFCLDWNNVAKSVGHGVTAIECEHQFLTMSIPTSNNNPSKKDGSVTPDGMSVMTSSSDPDPQQLPHSTTKQIQQDLICDIVNSADPAVIHAVTNAALTSTNGNIQQAQKAAVLGLMIHDVVDEVRQKEDNIVEVLSEILELRMQKIESRLSALDDVEDMLEAERVALELERRDLYTSRCRHWFGGT